MTSTPKDAARATETELNADHLREWEGDPWYEVLVEVDRQLIMLDPAYRIAQIKKKFGGLRYYYDSNIDFEDPVRQQMEDVIDRAEQHLRERDELARRAR